MSNHYAHRPFFYRLANNLGQRFSYEPSFELEYLLDKARKKTGLHDFGEGDFTEGLQVLLDAYKNEAQLNTIGKVSAQTYLLQLLCNRLRLQADRTERPEIAEQKIKQPIFIIGLPRSGTTFLHALLAEDTATRTPMTWEVMYPSPPPQASSFLSDSRIRRTTRDLAWVERLAPKFNSIHAVKAHLPQECIAITTHAFASIQFHTTHNVPSYQAWLEQSDMRGAYQYHQRFLQHLQSQHQADRWLLKAPGHLFDVAALLAVYPDARIIQTHRDPLKVVASISSHANVIRAAFSDVLEPTEIAKDWQQYWSRALQRMLDFRTQHPQQEVHDVYYTDLINDPIALVKDLYQRLDLEMTQAFEAALSNYVRRSKQSKHEYTLQEFGFEPSLVNQAFADYHQAYNVHNKFSEI